VPPAEPVASRATPPRHQTRQPWKRATANTHGFQRVSTPRKVGGASVLSRANHGDTSTGFSPIADGREPGGEPLGPPVRGNQVPAPCVSPAGGPRGRPAHPVEHLDLGILIARCQAGDELAWEAFVRRFQGRVYALACSYVADRDEARDLAQEVFVRLYERGGAGWRPKRSSHGSAGGPQPRDRLPALAPGARAARGPAGEEGARVADPSPGPAAALEQRSRRHLVQAALRRLSALSREVVMLRDVQGLSVREVAALLGVPTGTGEIAASRARVELAEEVLALGRERSQP